MVHSFLSLACFLAASSYGGSAPAPAPQAPMMQTPSDCSSLTTDEQNFAQQLSPTNKQLFCHTFNTAQRHAAMQMSRQPDSSGQMPSPDMSVRQVARDNQMMIPMTTPSPSDMGGGCPVE